MKKRERLLLLLFLLTTTILSVFVSEAMQQPLQQHYSGDDSTTMMRRLPVWTVCRTCRGRGYMYQRPKQHKKRPKLPPSSLTRKPCNKCLSSSGLVETNTDSPSAQAMNKPANFPHVAIIGGGLGGLALAVACQHRGIPYTVYERDASFQQRRQGYGLTMQQASKALKGFGIFQLQQGITSTKHLVHKPDGMVVAEWGLRKWKSPEEVEGSAAAKPVSTGNRRQNVHIARQALRNELLLQIAEPANIRWNHKLISIRDSVDGNCMELQFSVSGDKESIVTEQADLVVGADGIRSKVREYLLPGDNNKPLRYLDCIVILGICPLDRVPEEVVHGTDLLDGETVFQTADGTTRIYMMPYSVNTYMWQLSFPMDEDSAIQLSREGSVALHKEAIHRCHDWHSPVPEILHNTPEELISGYPVYDRELLQLENFALTDRVTLLGDACHPMSPFKGQGANQALLDALSLARALYEDGSNWKEEGVLGTILNSYHTEMLERSSQKVVASAKAAEFLHTEVAIAPGNVTRGAAAAAAVQQNDSSGTTEE